MKQLIVTLIACTVLIGCQTSQNTALEQPAADKSTVASLPAVDSKAVATELANTTCGDANPQRTIKSFGEYSTDDSAIGTLYAFAVRLCADGTALEDVIFWSGTNKAGNKLRAQAASLSGHEFHTIRSDYDREKNHNFLLIEFENADDDYRCRMIKPPQGISPLKVANCTKT